MLEFKSQWMINTQIILHGSPNINPILMPRCNIVKVRESDQNLIHKKLVEVFGTSDSSILELFQALLNALSRLRDPHIPSKYSNNEYSRMDQFVRLYKLILGKGSRPHNACVLAFIWSFASLVIVIEQVNSFNETVHKLVKKF